MRRAFTSALVVALVWGACAAGCGSSGGDQPQGSGDDGGASGDDGPGNLVTGEGGNAHQLTVSPQNPTLDVTAPGATEQFTALLDGAPTTAKWTIDVAAIGQIDANGMFTASGAVGGPVTVTAIAGQYQASTTLTIHLHLTENPGNVDPGTQGLLKGGGTADAAFKWLYPYDATVFPRDLPSPTLQFGVTVPASTVAFDAAYVHVSFASLDYEGFFGPTAANAPAQIKLPAATWTAIAGSSTGADAVKVEVTKISGGAVSGPIAETWTIAPGNLRGSIYYNSYNSAIAAPPPGTSFPAQNGAVLRMRPGQTPTLAIPTNNQGECHVCHAVSASGNMLVASDEPNGSTTLTAADGVWDLVNASTKVYDAANRTWDFGALTPDGTKFLRYGAVPWAQAAGQPWAPNVRGMGQNGDLPSALFDPKSGAPIAAPGLDGQNLHMMMPAFSSDGKHVAFNHYDTGKGTTVAVMDFDGTTNTFSNLRDIATVPAGQFAGWPAFTPDDEYVFFASGTNAEYDTLSDSPPNPPQPQSDILIAHVASATTASADALNGVMSGNVYLPFPDDPHLNFEPTILPVAAGGYYWVVFTTRRNYGNTVNGDAYAGPNGPSPRKKLWVAAISIDSNEHPNAKAVDTTHPAFYLDGQELAAGNMRAFWALDPCEQNGQSCSTGDECCSGFCRQTTGDDGGIVFACVPPNGCAHESEKCTTAADCCDVGSGEQCINGFCSRPTPK